jgi:hypothetical protein
LFYECDKRKKIKKQKRENLSNSFFFSFIKDKQIIQKNKKNNIQNKYIFFFLFCQLEEDSPKKRNKKEKIKETSKE